MMLMFIFYCGHGVTFFSSFIRCTALSHVFLTDIIGFSGTMNPEMSTRRYQ